jgi:hypothetical protein
VSALCGLQVLLASEYSARLHWDRFNAGWGRAPGAVLFFWCSVLQLVCQALKVVLEWVLLKWVVRLYAAQYQARHRADRDVEAAASRAERLPAPDMAGSMLPEPATRLMHSSGRSVVAPCPAGIDGQ